MTEFIKITDDLVTNSTGMAQLLGLSVRRIQQMTQDGTLQTESKGKYPIISNIRKYEAFINSKQDELDDEEAKYEKAKRTADLQIKAAKATMARISAAELQGKMHRAEDVEAMTADYLQVIRAGLLALPGRLAIDVSGVTPAEASDIIRKEVYKLMNELSKYKYDPMKYEERVRERLRWDSAQEDEDEEQE